MTTSKPTIEIDENCQFFKDLTTFENSQRNYNLGIYNLAICIRDVEMYSKFGMKLYCKGIKPNRKWRITPVKKYFGMTGHREVLLEKLQRLREIINEGE